MENRVSNLFFKFNKNVKNIQPTEEDLDGAVSGLLRLQKMYKLKTEDIVNGIIEGQKTSQKLSLHDIYTIAKHALFIGNNHYYVKKYMNELRKRLQEDGDEFKEIDEMSVNIIEKSVEAEQAPEPDTLVKDGTYSKYKENILYSQMCRGENSKSPKERALLKCRYVSTSPFSIIAPFKVEEADMSANLVVFHDVIYDSEIEILKNVSKSRFIRGTIYTQDTNTQKTDQRIAKVAWLKDVAVDVLDRISRRIEDMTGLTTKTAEELQIQNYGIGGHYQPHWDMKKKDEKPFDLGTGNRIATVLFYLSTVEKGGATVFPYLKVYVPAVKGMAAFWYNLKDNGDCDYYTRHAACPVLLGSKWVANKWIHEYEQEFIRPCSTGHYVETTEGGYIREFY
ncbi:prolyl 4-hydroxylase subunit alpha-2-like [Chironomus tepperi]|uniref:prolyl 4-hydroxylase subunit alpha-2-like n=1 Tax=Chironomus tepperi TaxID=113505 RepID=UPI00391EF330